MCGVHLVFSKSLFDISLLVIDLLTRGEPRIGRREAQNPMAQLKIKGTHPLHLCRLNLTLLNKLSLNYLYWSAPMMLRLTAL